MTERKDFKEKMPVTLSKTMTHSIDQGWQSKGNRIVDNEIHNVKTIGFHPSVDDAMQIEYHYMGNRETTYVHWRDLMLVDQTPNTPPEPVLFDVKNLDI